MPQKHHKMEVYLSPNRSWPNWVRICDPMAMVCRCGVGFPPRNPPPPPVELDLGFIEEDDDVMEIN